MNAPGTAKITTFLPLNASVVSFDAVPARCQRVRAQGRARRDDVRAPHAECDSSSGL